MQRPARALYELRPCIRGSVQISSPPRPFIYCGSVSGCNFLDLGNSINLSVCMTSMRLPFERVTVINMHAFAYIYNRDSSELSNVIHGQPEYV